MILYLVVGQNGVRKFPCLLTKRIESLVDNLEDESRHHYDRKQGIFGK